MTSSAGGGAATPVPVVVVPVVVVPEAVLGAETVMLVPPAPFGAAANTSPS